jgi:tryptophan synthase beta chain
MLDLKRLGVNAALVGTVLVEASESSDPGAKVEELAGKESYIGKNLREELFTFNRSGYYGEELGGASSGEDLRAALEELTEAFYHAKDDPVFWSKLKNELSSYSCRPTPVTHLPNLSSRYMVQFYLKREDLNHTGAHKINNVMAQGLLTKRMKKKRVIAETGAGQHGVAVATMAARLGLECKIYMGIVDIERQRPNVFWMEQLGAKVHPVKAGTGTLKDAINACLRDWSEHADTTHYVLGTACGPHPFPQMVATFQSIIGDEARQQMRQMIGKLPTRVYACAGGGSNALGMFLAFLNDYRAVELVSVEAAGKGLDTGQHAARLAGFRGSVGTAQGYTSYFLQNEDGQMKATQSVAAGLDYIGVSPILAYLYERGRVRVASATDKEVIDAFQITAREEGILPALESAHAIAAAIREAPELSSDDVILINLSGRGDKDIFNIADNVQDESGDKWREFIQAKAAQYGHRSIHP